MKNDLMDISSKSYRASRNMSFKSSDARNMNMLWCNLISVMELVGNEWPTANRPTLRTQRLIPSSYSDPMGSSTIHFK